MKLFAYLTASLLMTAPAAAQIVGDGSTHPNGEVVDYTGSWEIPADDGTRSGANLFHSFGVFHIPEDVRARFTAGTDTGPFEHVIARVTGGDRGGQCAG